MSGVCFCGDTGIERDIFREGGAAYFATELGTRLDEFGWVRDEARRTQRVSYGCWGGKRRTYASTAPAVAPAILKEYLR